MLVRKIILALGGLAMGVGIAYFAVYGVNGENPVIKVFEKPKPQVIGFLPFWLLSKAKTDYSAYINTLTYFSLIVDKDGTIQKYTKKTEGEPGYFTLKNGKADSFLNSAKDKKVALSVAVFSSDDDSINSMLGDPDTSSKNLVNDIGPIMQQYGFTDLNLDIEQVSDASPSARTKFTQFVKGVRSGMKENKLGTLSIDVSASAFVKNTNLFDPGSIVASVDKVILMAYDYHFSGSFVTGPVAPGLGAGSISEFDTETAVEEALKVIPSDKLILGIPLYGYEWESLGNTPRSATLPSSGLIISNARAEDFLAGCATCSATFDETDKETHVIFEDLKTGTFHQFFFPDKKATAYKVGLAKNNALGGVALWALGYEGHSILEPLSSFGH